MRSQAPAVLATPVRPVRRCLCKGTSPSPEVERADADDGGVTGVADAVGRGGSLQIRP